MQTIRKRQDCKPTNRILSQLETDLSQIFQRDYPQICQKRANLPVNPPSIRENSAAILQLVARSPLRPLGLQVETVDRTLLGQFVDQKVRATEIEPSLFCYEIWVAHCVCRIGRSVRSDFCSICSNSRERTEWHLSPVSRAANLRWDMYQ